MVGLSTRSPNGSCNRTIQTQATLIILLLVSTQGSPVVDGGFIMLKPTKSIWRIK